MTDTIRFHVTQARMAEAELGELLDIQENPNDVKAVARFMARFMADADGNYLEDDEAMKAVRRIKIGQIYEAFAKATGDMQEIAAPNV